MLMKLLKFGAIGLALALIIGRLELPHLLNGFGLPPHYELPENDLSGSKALNLTTSHDTLGESGKSTGVFASEMTAPHFAFLDSGVAVYVASIKGGQIPAEAMSLNSRPSLFHID